MQDTSDSQQTGIGLKDFHRILYRLMGLPPPMIDPKKNLLVRVSAFKGKKLYLK
jgi:hypothetical protein